MGRSKLPAAFAGTVIRSGRQRMKWGDYVWARSAVLSGMHWGVVGRLGCQIMRPLQAAQRDGSAEPLMPPPCPAVAGNSSRVGAHVLSVDIDKGAPLQQLPGRTEPHVTPLDCLSLCTAGLAHMAANPKEPLASANNTASQAHLQLHVIHGRQHNQDGQ